MARKRGVKASASAAVCGAGGEILEKRISSEKSAKSERRKPQISTAAGETSAASGKLALASSGIKYMAGYQYRLAKEIIWLMTGWRIEETSICSVSAWQLCSRRK